MDVPPSLVSTPSTAGLPTKSRKHTVRAGTERPVQLARSKGGSPNHTPGWNIQAHRIRRNERRRVTRQYLTRRDLLDPRSAETPWLRIFRGRSNRAFITTMGLDVSTFELILQAMEYERRFGIEDLQPFYSCAGDIGHPRIRRWTVELAAEREEAWRKRGSEWAYKQTYPEGD